MNSLSFIIDKFLHSGRFDAFPNPRGVTAQEIDITNLLTSIAEHEPSSLNVLINYVSLEVFDC